MAKIIGEEERREREMIDDDARRVFWAWVFGRVGSVYARDGVYQWQASDHDGETVASGSEQSANDAVERTWDALMKGAEEKLDEMA